MPLFLAGPIVKLIALALAVAALFGLGYYRGYAAEKQAWDAAIAKQAVKSADTVIKAAENTAKVVTRYIKVKGDTQLVIETVEKEVIRYVDTPHPTCVLDRQFERVWDAGSNRLPAAAGPPSGPDGIADSGLTPATVLRAHADDANTYAKLRDAYRALVEWNKTTYLIQKEGAGR